MSDKAAAAELASGWYATASDLLDADALACAGGTPSSTLPKHDSYQTVATIDATMHVRLTLGVGLLTGLPVCHPAFNAAAAPRVDTRSER